MLLVFHLLPLPSLEKILDLPLLTHVHSHITQAVAAMDSCRAIPSQQLPCLRWSSDLIQAKKHF